MAHYGPAIALIVLANVRCDQVTFEAPQFTFSHLANAISYKYYFRLLLLFAFAFPLLLPQGLILDSKYDKI